jgi:hypothetical protein
VQRRGNEVATVLTEREFPRGVATPASPHCMAVVLWVRALLEMHRVRCAPAQA